jgi:hypothetical protein
MGTALSIGGYARAATITDTESVTPVNLFNNVLNTGSNSGSPNLYASFAGFNTSLGTFVSVSYAVDYKFSATINFNGGSGAGSFAVAGPYLLVGQSGTTAGASAGPNFSSISASGNYEETQSGLTGGSFTSGLVDSPYTFGLQSYSNFSGGGQYGAYGTLALTSGTVTATYNYTPTAVPEPASLSLLGLAAPALLGRRRKMI